MKNSLNKYSKEGSLSLHLQRYQLSPNSNKKQQKTSEIESQQITMTVLKMQNRQSRISRKNNSKEKNQRQSSQKYQKSSSIKLDNQKSDVQNDVLQEQDQIFNRCLSLTSKIETLKKQKLQNAIQQFEQEEHRKMEFLLQKQKKVINLKYNQKKIQFKVSYEKESNKLSKAIQDINKLKSAYLRIFQDLNDRRNNMNKEYEISVEKIKQAKEKLVNEWKRSSNQEIMKKTNKHF